MKYRIKKFVNRDYDGLLKEVITKTFYYPQRSFLGLIWFNWHLKSTDTWYSQIATFFYTEEEARKFIDSQKQPARETEIIEL